MSAGAVVLLRTSARVAPGLLTVDSWRLLESAAVVLAAEGHAQVDALRAAGIEVSTLEPSVDGWALVERLAAEAADDRRGDRPVVWLAADDGDPFLADALGGTARSLTGSVDLPGARMLDLVAVMDRLRSPGGCPWDAAQTHATLVPYLLEEAYEAVEAVETGDRAALREELGDVLLQVVFHSRVAQEHRAEPWTVDDVAGDIVAKLVARHPHVFGDADADTAAQVEASWEVLKRAEKGRTSAVDGVPLAQPALALAAKLMSRAEKSGVDVDLPGLRVQAEDPTSPEELGNLLLAVVARARAHGLDPEAALREAARRYASAVRAAEETRGSGSVGSIG